MNKNVLIAVGLILIFLACGGPSKDGLNEEKGSDRTETAPKKEIDGAPIFKKYCLICHGSNGDMGANGAHNLQESTLNLEDRIKVITNGRNTMTPFKEVLSEEKIEAVAKYVATFRK